MSDSKLNTDAKRPEASRPPEWRVLFAGLLAAGYLLFVSIEAPIRFYMGPLAQAKDLLLLSIIGLAFFNRHLNWRLLLACGLAAAAAVWGFYINRSGAPMAVALGVKQALPWLAGISMAAIAPPEQYIRTQLSRRLYATFFSGVFLLITMSCVVDAATGALPWSGSTQEIMGQEVETSREWSADSVRRVAGTARSSFDAASMLAISALAMGFLVRSKTLRVIGKGIAMVAIYLTTSKAALVAFAASALTNGFAFESENPNRLQRFLKGSLLLATVTAMIILPLSSLSELDSVFRDLRLAEGFSGASFAERLEIVWPQAIRDVLDSTAVLGFGIGGVGAPLSTYAPELFVPTDNLFVYLMNLVGALSLPALFFITVGCWNLLKRKRSADQCLLALALFTLNYGITASVLECSWLSFFLCFGCATGLGFSPQTRR
ncbi:MAG: hypothetical protein U0892_11530 [Pirellulales bacterium]